MSRCIGCRLTQAGSEKTQLVLTVNREGGCIYLVRCDYPEKNNEHGCCDPAMEFTSDALLFPYYPGNPEDGNCLARCFVRIVLLMRLQSNEFGNDM